MEHKDTRISSLKFSNYVVDEVNFITNSKAPKKNIWNLGFDINNITNINKEKNKMEIVLMVSIFKGQEDAPFHMNVKITGYFELVGEDDISKFEANAIAIMYPYLRAIVSTYTASANISPVILPAINVNAMLKNKKEQEEMKKN